MSLFVGDSAHSVRGMVCTHERGKGETRAAGCEVPLPETVSRRPCFPFYPRSTPHHSADVRRRNLHRTTTMQELAEPPSKPTMLQTTESPPRKGTQFRKRFANHRFVNRIFSDCSMLATISSVRFSFPFKILETYCWIQFVRFNKFNTDLRPLI